MVDKARKALEDAFRTFDTDKSGSIALHELQLLLMKLTDTFHVEHPGESDVMDIFTGLDVNGDGKINRAEFEPLINEVVSIMQ